MTNLTEQYRELEQDFFAYQKMLNEANKDLNKYYLENTKLKEILMSARNYLKSYRDLYSKDNEDVVDFIKEIDQVLQEKE